MKKTLLFVICLTTYLTNAQTNLIWAKQMGGTYNDLANSVVVDSLGNVYTKGYFRGACDFDPGSGTFTLSPSPAGSDEVFISKLDASGNFVWAKKITGISSAGSNAMASDASGNIYITGGFSGTVDFDLGSGTFNMTSSGNSDIFILKLNSFGNFVWAKKFGAPYGDIGYSITVDAYKNVYTAGCFFGSVDFDPGPGSYVLTTGQYYPHAFISKLDSVGNFILAKSIADFNFTFDDIISNSIKVNNNNNIFLTGSFKGAYDFDPGVGVTTFTSGSSGNSNDVFILKLDSVGNFVWAKQIGGNSEDAGSGLALDPDGDVYTTGYYSGIVDFDPGPGTFTLASEGGKDIFISKLDSTGNFVWAKTIGGVYDDYGRSIAVDGLNNVYSAGSFSLAADFDTGPGIFYLSTYGYANGFILKLNSSGNFVWAGKIGGVDCLTDIKSIVLDESNIYSTGFFQYIVDFDCGPNTYTLTSINTTQDAFVHKMSFTTLGIKKIQETTKVAIYPIPVIETLIIEFDAENFKGMEKHNRLKLINSLGMVLFQQDLPDNKTELNLKNIKSGLYYLEIQNDNNSVVTKKIIKL